jgi:hypothetical protein
MITNGRLLPLTKAKELWDGRLDPLYVTQPETEIT